MNSFLWWSGVVAWTVLGLAGALWLFDLAIEWFMDSLKFKREFLEWVWAKLKAKRDASSSQIPAG